MVAPASWSRAPRQVSIALTNRCDLACMHCYAPKSRHELPFDTVTRWLGELDAHGALGVGFGGGEPTLYRRFAELCQHVARETMLAVSFTTHGHHIDHAMADSLQGSVHFIRVSMDGVHRTYESIRRRPFDALLQNLRNIQRISRFGINTVVNERTVEELNEVASTSADAGATELLLLPQNATHAVVGASDTTLHRLRRWVSDYSGPLRLSLNAEHAEGFPICEPLHAETGLRAYAHIDATGRIKPNSYDQTGLSVGHGSVLKALDILIKTLEQDRP
ncbi:MAG: radical SAM protein [Myxococcota bacterium]|nr:radical SAM protein [Myxococcota bacterium]